MPRPGKRHRFDRCRHASCFWFALRAISSRSSLASSSGIHSNGTHDMKLSIAVATVLASSTLIGATLSAAAGSDQGLPCIARVIHSEELPFAPINYWLVKVTLEITPPNGGAFITTLQDSISWQVAPPRRGQTFRLRC